MSKLWIHADYYRDYYILVVWVYCFGVKSILKFGKKALLLGLRKFAIFQNTWHKKFSHQFVFSDISSEGQRL